MAIWRWSQGEQRTRGWRLGLGVPPSFRSRPWPEPPSLQYEASVSCRDHILQAVPALWNRGDTAIAEVGRLTVNLKLGLFRVTREVTPDDQVRFTRVTFQLQLDPGFLRRVVLAVRRELGRATEYLCEEEPLGISRLVA